MSCRGCEFLPELYYDDEYQIWVRSEADGSLTVGMTDLSQTIAGRILHLRVRRPGTLRPAGKPVATIESGKWAGPIPNFFDCVIVEGNSRVLSAPSLLNTDPYGAWVARVRPERSIEEVLGLFFTGSEARRGYCARAERDEIDCKRLEHVPATEQ